jgi:hypothetical protein
LAPTTFSNSPVDFYHLPVAMSISYWCREARAGLKRNKDLGVLDAEVMPFLPQAA